MSRTSAVGAGSQRGAGTLMAAILVLAMLALMGLLAAGAYAARARAVTEGAADLAAVAGGHAQLAGLAACTAAERTAQGNEVELEDCRVAGDEVEFVVTVTVRHRVTWGPWTQTLQARANAGVLTGAPG